MDHSCFFTSLSTKILSVGYHPLSTCYCWNIVSNSPALKEKPITNTKSLLFLARKVNNLSFIRYTRPYNFIQIVAIGGVICLAFSLFI